MGQPSGRHAPTPQHRIQINLRSVDQLFNTMDPSPFHEKDLDGAAEVFILSRAQALHQRDPINLVIHLSKAGAGSEPAWRVEQAVRRHFLYRAKLGRIEFKRLLRDARTSLIIGATFLCGCLIASELLAAAASHTLQRILGEGLMIAGWVAMWRPLQMYLYDWWPVRRRVRLFQKMSRISVRVVVER